MSNDVTELRAHLFDVLRGLKDGSVKVETAKAVNETAQTIINSARVEIDALEIIGGQGTGFIPLPAPPENNTPSLTVIESDRGRTTIEQRNGVMIRRHTTK